MEIVTLQFGQYANFVGAHYWNIQEEQVKQERFQNKYEINPEYLGRAPESKGKTSYSPRVLLFDYRGGLGNLKRSIRPTSSDQVAFKTWSDRTEIFQHDFNQSLDQPATNNNLSTNTQNPLQLESSVKVWTDFSTANLNLDKNVHELSDFNLDDHYENEEGLVDPFSAIEEFYTSLKLEEMSDKLRVITEACNNLQGFQVLVEISAGVMGALSTKFLEYLKYEEGYKQPIFTLAINNNIREDSIYDTNEFHIRDKLNQRLINRVLAQSKLHELSSLYVPVETRNLIQKKYFPLLNTKSLAYHTSALVASAFDTLTSSYRLTNGNAAMSTLINTLARGQNQHKMASLSFALPFSYLNGAKQLNAAQLLMDDNLYKSKLLSGHFLPSTDTLLMPNAEAVVLRGVQGVDTSLPQNVNLDTCPQLNVLSHIQSVESALLAHLNSYGCPSRQRSVIKSGVALPSSYPAIFTEDSQKYGSSIENYEGSTQAVHTMPALSYLAAGNRLKMFVQQQVNDLQRVDFSRYPQFNLERDDISEIKNELISLQEHHA